MPAGELMSVPWSVKVRPSAIALVLLLSASRLAAAEGQIRFIHDPRPEADIPREARSAGTRPDPDARPGPDSNIAFRIVTDLRDYGPLRNVVTQSIHVVSVRYFEGSFGDIHEVQRYLTTLLHSDKGSTTAYCPWAESLPVPAIEATIQFTSGGTGKLLVWRQGRLAYRDPDMKWWFTRGW